MPETQEIRDMREQIASLDRQVAENRHGLNNARQVIDIKLDKITGDILDLKNVLKWAGSLIISLMISFMAWAALQQYNANETQKRDLQEQVKLLQSQEAAAKDRDAILRQLQEQSQSSAGGTQTTVTPIGNR